MKFDSCRRQLSSLGVPSLRRQDRPTVGLKAGLSLANVSFDDDLGETSNRTGLVTGLFASVPVNSRVAFQPELLYAMKGAKIDIEGNEATLKVDYVEVPLLADVRLNAGTTRVSLVAGPSFGFRSRARLEFAGESADVSEEVRRVDVGLATGIAVTAGRFVLDGHYTWSLRNAASRDVENAGKNRALSITGGWRFR